jgi:small subunit ribosomal protein S9
MPTAKKTIVRKPRAKKTKPTKVEKIKVAPANKVTKIEKEILVIPTDNDIAGNIESVFVEDKGDRIEKYYEAIGRRKESTARVRVFTKKSTDIQKFEDKGIISVNDKPYYEYFNFQALQDIVDSPLKKLKSLNRFKATVKVSGGGIHGQADAIKFGLSRALVLFDPNFAKKLRKAGYLTRDSREKERRKYGLKKARKSPAWSKR